MKIRDLVKACGADALLRETFEREIVIDARLSNGAPLGRDVVDLAAVISGDGAVTLRIVFGTSELTVEAVVAQMAATLAPPQAL